MVRSGLPPGGTHSDGRSFGISAGVGAEGRNSHRLGRKCGRRPPDLGSGSSNPDIRRSEAGSSLGSRHCRTDRHRARVAIERVCDVSCYALASSLGRSGRVVHWNDGFEVMVLSCQEYFNTNQPYFVFYLLPYSSCWFASMPLFLAACFGVCCPDLF